MSFSVGLQHINGTITWLYDFQLNERMFHDITAFFALYMRQVFVEKPRLTAWEVRKVYDEFDWMFGSVAMVVINPTFYTYDLEDPSLSTPLEPGVLFFSCKVGDQFECVALLTHEDDKPLEALLKRAGVMTPDGQPEEISMNRIAVQYA
jgi:hypothetical protein